jgi:hypothetical protein
MGIIRSAKNLVIGEPEEPLHEDRWGKLHHALGEAGSGHRRPVQQQHPDELGRRQDRWAANKDHQANDLDGIAALARETEQLALYRETLGDPLQEIPLTETNLIENEYEKFATAIERELIDFKRHAEESIARGLGLAKDVREKGKAHSDRVKREIAGARETIENIQRLAASLKVETANAPIPSPKPPEPPISTDTDGGHDNLVVAPIAGQRKAKPDRSHE